MKFGITNLSWKEDDDYTITKKLEGFDYFETVFSRRNNGNFYSVQSIFYGSDIKSFNDKEVLSYINYIIEECYRCNIQIIVFGSPSLRKGSKENLLDVFRLINDSLREKKIYLCVEPNSKYYGGDYYYTLSEIVADIEKYSNIKTMIDTHNLLLEGEDIFDQYQKYSEHIKHIHISEKDLVPIKNWSLYKDYISFLKQAEYRHGITYELKQCKNIISEAKKFLKQK